MNQPSQTRLFDSQIVRRYRERVAPFFESHAQLFDEAWLRLQERRDDIRRVFEKTLVIGGRGRVASSFSFAEQDVPILPHSEGDFDLVLSLLDLHSVNDVPRALSEMYRVLRKGGAFGGVLLGGGTLVELRQCFLEVEAALLGGISPHTAPMIDLSSAGRLISAAGFALPIVDSERIQITYPDVRSLMKDLRGMGERNALVGRSRRFMRRDVLRTVDNLYKSRFPAQGGGILASFDLLFLHGWREN